MNEHAQTSEKQSLLHGFLSFILPGLGQIVAGQWTRGISFLISILVLGGLSVWTIAQRARYPDYALSLNIFTILVLQSAALLILLYAMQRLLARFVIKDPALRSFSGYGVGILYFVLVLFTMDSFLDLAGTQEALKQVFESTAVLSAAALAALWMWQAADASRVGAKAMAEMLPSLGGGILIACLLIFSLGFNITGINLAKAISEYKDTEIILSRIVWPWRNAFEFEQIAIEVAQKIQAPCPEGETGPPPNEPVEGEAWISATPTCGQMTQRDLRGNVTLGTELTIVGGGFAPDLVVGILWKNPIGNPFTPRGVGDTEITIEDDGTFETTLFIPEATVASTSLGEQIHTLIVRQESEEVFTGRLSKEMNLALVGMLETIMIGLMATFFGILLAFPVSFLAARNLMVPIIQPLGEVVGGLFGLVVGIGLAGLGTGQVVTTLGGLDKAPVQIFGIGLVLVIGLAAFGMQLGTRLFKGFNRLGPGVSNLITALGLTALAAAPGYLLGIGFSRGIVSIPLSAEVAAQSESLYGVAGAILLGALALIFALRTGAKQEFSVGLVIYGIVRTLMNIVRSIEPLIWAIVGAIWVGLGPFAGTIALTLHTIAALGKLYSESIESIEPGPIEALQATGATRLQTIIYAVIPQILPPFISFTIYRWDINVRMSTIIGLVGGGGIGFILIQWIRQFQYENAGIAVWLITITVATLDFVSSNIRERFV